MQSDYVAMETSICSLYLYESNSVISDIALLCQIDVKFIFSQMNNFSPGEAVMMNKCTSFFCDNSFSSQPSARLYNANANCDTNESSEGSLDIYMYMYCTSRRSSTVQVSYQQYRSSFLVQSTVGQ